MRHATTMGTPKGVKEHNLRWYLKHLRDYPYRWKVAGVSILYPKYPSDQGMTPEPVIKEPEKEQAQDIQ